MGNNFDFGCHGNEIWNEAKFLCQVLTACKVSNKSNRRLLRYCTFIFSLSCSIASVTSYLSENEAENLENGDVHLAQIPDFEMEYFQNHMAHWGRWWLVFFFFFIFHALSFELNCFSNRMSPLRLGACIFSRALFNQLNKKFILCSMQSLPEIFRKNRRDFPENLPNIFWKYVSLISSKLVYIRMLYNRFFVFRKYTDNFQQISKILRTVWMDLVFQKLTFNRLQELLLNIIQLSLPLEQLLKSLVKSPHLKLII